MTGGHIYIDGQDIQQVTLKSLRQQIGVVQQDVYLFSGTVAEYRLRPPRRLPGGDIGGRPSGGRGPVHPGAEGWV